MKRFLILVGVAVVAAAMYVAAGSASQTGGVSPAKFNALEKKVAALSKTLKTVKVEAMDADQFLRSCMLPPSNGGVLPINEYGDPAGTFGYKYTDNGVDVINTTAIDADPAPSNTTAWIQVVDSACVAALKHHQAGHLGGRLSQYLHAEHVR